MNLTKTTCDKIVTVSGNALVLNVSREMKMLGVEKGEIVRITLEKIN